MMNRLKNAAKLSLNGEINERADGWMEGWADGWADGWVAMATSSKKLPASHRALLCWGEGGGGRRALWPARNAHPLAATFRIS